jgi:hypothetical protein
LHGQSLKELKVTLHGDTGSRLLRFLCGHRSSDPPPQLPKPCLPWPDLVRHDVNPTGRQGAALGGASVTLPPSLGALVRRDEKRSGKLFNHSRPKNTGIPVGIFQAENENRENGRENGRESTPTVPCSRPVFLFFLWRWFTTDLDGKRSFPFSTLLVRMVELLAAWLADVESGPRGARVSRVVCSRPLRSRHQCGHPRLLCRCSHVWCEVTCHQLGGLFSMLRGVSHSCIV